MRTTDSVTRAHLEDVRDQIAKILDPKFAAPAPAPAGGGQAQPGVEELDNCWPDYVIRVSRG